MSSTLSPKSEIPEQEIASPIVDALLASAKERLASRRLPEATYRLQVNHAFTFRDARRIVDYLAALGISDCYLSPYMMANAGSEHGYDIVNHNALNPEIGTEQDYHAFVETLKSHGLGQIVDVVPNHMGIGGENAWWTDVLENGPGSPYAAFFDIDWRPLKPDLANKVLLPILGDQFGKVLEDQQLVLSFEEGGFWLHYYQRRFPIAPHSWAMILQHRIDELQQALVDDEEHLLEYQSILTGIGHLPAMTETDPQKVSERRREKEVVKRRLKDLADATPRVASFIQENVALFNGTPGDPHSFDLLEQLLAEQPYRLAYWRVASDEINYRRFFDVNELAAICMENPDVFEQTHRLILRLVNQGQVQGLRIDHPDGLYDPPEYLRRLQKARFLQVCQQVFDERFANGTVQPEPIAQTAPTSTSAQSENGDGSAASEPPATEPPASEAPTWEALEPVLADRFEALARTERNDLLTRPLYVVVEKILEPGERLPESWPVHGTTGYDFLANLNGIFVERTNAKAFDRLYETFAKERVDFRELVYRCKLLIMQASMSAEVSVLGHELDRISERNRRSRDFTLNSLTEALREVIACFPVYRTYVNPTGVLERDRRYIEMAVSRAKRKNPATSTSIFDLVRAVLLLNQTYAPDDEAREALERFVGRFQQFTGPVMAKAVEDTAFYIHNRLVSLNEVGGDPEIFGTMLSSFHQQNIERQAHWPHSLLATSTHDTKRSEDVRARINILSEIPREFRARIFRWARMNQPKKILVEDAPAPLRNDEFLLYQTLIGTWPLDPHDPPERDQYRERIQNYMLKATREAKVNTSWVSPNEDYERATREFVGSILDTSRRNPFLADFEPFAQRISELGLWNSLSQTVLKLASAGVPDLYQGTEIWDFSLVDPDNRRPVDYERRRDLLRSLETRLAESPDALGSLARELVASPRDGRIKLFVIWRMLNFRRQHPNLLTCGRYIPLDATGSRAEHVCGFVRKNTHSAVLVVASRLIAKLNDAVASPPLGRDIWGDTSVSLPNQLQSASFRNLFTGEIVSPSQPGFSETGRWPIGDLLAAFPVAVLERID
jgi:(1->4)-alpha-D-glucan 1-alpha-D-glucosylmutase